MIGRFESSPAWLARRKKEVFGFAFHVSLRFIFVLFLSVSDSVVGVCFCVGIVCWSVGI